LSPNATRLRLWLPVVAWAALMFGFSTDAFSSEHSAGIIIGILHWLLPSASASTLDLLHLLIRKSAHVFEYFVFSLLLLRAIRGDGKGWEMRWAIWALVIAAVYACLDEFHQSFVPSRTASPWDALLDTAGAALAQMGAWIAMARRGRSQNHK
jgi:VanZ family protein